MNRVAEIFRALAAVNSIQKGSDGRVSVHAARAYDHLRKAYDVEAGLVSDEDDLAEEQSTFNPRYQESLGGRA